MPPCICTALWPQNLPDLPICTLAPEAALRRTIESLSSILSDAIRVIERAARGARQHDDVVGRRGIVDHALVAAQRPARAFLGGLERHIGQVVTRLALQPGEGELLLALYHGRQQRLLLGLGAGLGDHAA